MKIKDGIDGSCRIDECDVLTPGVKNGLKLLGVTTFSDLEKVSPRSFLDIKMKGVGEKKKREFLRLYTNDSEVAVTQVDQELSNETLSCSGFPTMKAYVCAAYKVLTGEEIDEKLLPVINMRLCVLNNEREYTLQETALRIGGVSRQLVQQKEKRVVRRLFCAPTSCVVFSRFLTVVKNYFEERHWVVSANGLARQLDLSFGWVGTTALSVSKMCEHLRLPVLDNGNDGLAYEFELRCASRYEYFVNLVKRARNKSHVEYEALREDFSRMGPVDLTIEEYKYFGNKLNDDFPLTAASENPWRRWIAKLFGRPGSQTVVDRHQIMIAALRNAGKRGMTELELKEEFQKQGVDRKGGSALKEVLNREDKSLGCGEQLIYCHSGRKNDPARYALVSAYEDLKDEILKLAGTIRQYLDQSGVDVVNVGGLIALYEGKEGLEPICLYYLLKVWAAELFVFRGYPWICSTSAEIKENVPEQIRVAIFKGLLMRGVHRCSPKELKQFLVDKLKVANMESAGAVLQQLNKYSKNLLKDGSDYLIVKPT